MIIETKIRDIELCFKTIERLFSPNHIDKGTLAMLSAVELKENDKVLDLGCGYGAVGIYAAKVIGAGNVVMTDIDGTAVRLSKENAELNGLKGLRIMQGDAYEGIEDNDFSVILVNPPYHTDFALAKRYIEKGFNRLCVGGSMYMVTKRKEWYKNKLSNVFGGVRIRWIDGYWVFNSVKRSDYYAFKLAEKLRK